MRRVLAAVVAGFALAALSLAAAGTASAHATRIATDPADHAALTASPQRVSATFNEALQQTFADMTVVGPDGNSWSTGNAQVQGAVIGIDLRPLGPTGTYTVNYRVTSADGHVVSGSWSFDLTVAGSGTPGPPVGSASGSDGSLPVWPFVVVAAVIVGGGAWWVLRRRA